MAVMSVKQIANFLNDNQDVLIGISLDDYYLNVNYVLDYNIDEDNIDEIVLSCYEVDNGCIVDYEFTLEDLCKRDLKFYKLEEIEV